VAGFYAKKNLPRLDLDREPARAGWLDRAADGRAWLVLPADLDTEFLDGLQRQAAMWQVVLPLIGIDRPHRGIPQ